MATALVREYTAEPTLAKFHADTSFVKYIAGPLGSGKSSGCIMEILYRAVNQQPNADGVRQTRWAFVRNHYPELKSTTIKTYQEWIPNSIAPVVYSTPIVSRLIQRLADGTTLDMEVLFLALDLPEDVSKLLSIEFTGAYLNEARELAWETMEAIVSRTPRFPKTIKDENGVTTFGPTYPGVVLDSNPPRNTHWLYEKFETGKTPPRWAKFQQPPAIYFDDVTEKWYPSPDAENLLHLADDYYQVQIDAAGDKHDFLRVNLGGEFGMSRKGKPVFRKYSEFKHVSKEPLTPHRGSPLLIGLDFGLNPGAVLGQLQLGGARFFDELYGTDDAFEDFLNDSLIPLLTTKYAGYNVIAVGDPAGRGRSGIDKRTPFTLLAKANIKAFPANTNNFIPRKEAVDYFLGRTDGLLLDPSLAHLRAALGGGYVYREARNNRGQVFDTPDKNEFSHISDALQYWCLHARYGGRNLPNAGSRLDDPRSARAPRKVVLWA